MISWVESYLETIQEKCVNSKHQVNISIVTNPADDHMGQSLTGLAKEHCQLLLIRRDSRSRPTVLQPLATLLHDKQCSAERLWYPNPLLVGSTQFEKD